MSDLETNIKEYVQGNPIRFHMPGHSGISNGKDLFDIYKYDITELSFSDNLQFPSSEILRMEEKLAKLYSVKNSFVLTGGATTGIQIASLILRDMGGRIAILGEPHKVILSAVKIFNLKLVAYNENFQNIDAVYITSPNYLGQTYKRAQEIIEKAREKGILTIVDEAHGAHFPLCELFPKSFAGIADIEITSLHKTLPVLTGAAVINVDNEKIAEKCLIYRQRIHTTSPSYLTLFSIDKFLNSHQQLSQIYFFVKNKVSQILDKSTQFKIVYYDDFTRLSVIVDKNAEEVERYLRKNNIYVEGIIKNHIILIVTPFNYIHLDYLVDVLNSYREGTPNNKNNEEKEYLIYNKRYIDVEEAVSKRSAFDIGIYPPGEIVTFAGEQITQEAVKKLKNASATFGLINGKILIEGDDN